MGAMVRTTLLAVLLLVSPEFSRLGAQGIPYTVLVTDTQGVMGETTEPEFLIEHDGRLTPIECKLKQRPSERDLRGIAKLRKFYGAEVAHAFVACTTELRFDLGPTATAISGWRASEIAERL